MNDRQQATAGIILGCVIGLTTVLLMDGGRLLGGSPNNAAGSPAVDAPVLPQPAPGVAGAGLIAAVPRDIATPTASETPGAGDATGQPPGVSPTPIDEGSAGVTQLAPPDAAPGTLQPTVTPTPEAGQTPTASATPSASPRPAASPMPAASPRSTPTPDYDPTPTPDRDPTPTPSPPPAASPTPAPSPSPTVQPTPTPTPTPDVSPTPTPTPDVGPTPTPAPTPTPTPQCILIICF